MNNTLKLTLAYMAVLFVASSLPSTPDTVLVWDPFALLDPVIQNFLHLPAYGLLALLWIKTLDESGVQAPFNMVAAVAIASAFGMITEFSQVWVPGRYPSVLDWLFDSTGALVSVGLLRLGQRESPSASLGPSYDA